MKLSYQHTVWACNFGFISQAVVNNLAPLLFVVFKEQFGLTDEQLGRLILMNFGTQIVASWPPAMWTALASAFARLPRTCSAPAG